jgi:hypothetical protein
MAYVAVLGSLRSREPQAGTQDKYTLIRVSGMASLVGSSQGQTSLLSVVKSLRFKIQFLQDSKVMLFKCWISFSLDNIIYFRP